jgi:hypothetical protein
VLAGGRAAADLPVAVGMEAAAAAVAAPALVSAAASQVGCTKACFLCVAGCVCVSAGCRRQVSRDARACSVGDSNVRAAACASHCDAGGGRNAMRTKHAHTHSLAPPLIPPCAPVASLRGCVGAACACALRCPEGALCSAFALLCFALLLLCCFALLCFALAVLRPPQRPCSSDFRNSDPSYRYGQIRVRIAASAVRDAPCGTDREE